MENRFLKTIHDNQNIIYKICRMYRDNKEDQEDRTQPGIRIDQRICQR